MKVSIFYDYGLNLIKSILTENYVDLSDLLPYNLFKVASKLRFISYSLDESALKSCVLRAIMWFFRSQHHQLKLVLRYTVVHIMSP